VQSFTTDLTTYEICNLFVHYLTTLSERSAEWMDDRRMVIWKERGSRNSALGIAAGYGLDGRRVGLRVPVRAIFFSTP
jgi:hypothetical protein